MYLFPEAEECSKRIPAACVTSSNWGMFRYLHRMGLTPGRGPVPVAMPCGHARPNAHMQLSTATISQATVLHVRLSRAHDIRIPQGLLFRF
jgi:hypothetical protein